MIPQNKHIAYKCMKECMAPISIPQIFDTLLKIDEFNNRISEDISEDILDRIISQTRDIRWSISHGTNFRGKTYEQKTNNRTMHKQ